MSSRYLGAGKNFGNQVLSGLADGSLATDAATWGQVQAFVRGLKYKAARVRSTGNLTLSGAQTIDGVSAIAGDVVLADSQTTGATDGLYVVAAGAWARSTDFATGFDATSSAVIVSEGTVNGDKLFIQTAEPAIVGTNGLTYVALGGGVTYTADGNGIELTSTVFSLELDGTTLAKSSSGVRIGSGAAGAGLVESSGVLAVGAGSGVTVAADSVAIDTGVVSRWFSNAATHSSGTTVSLTHNLGRKSYTTTVIIDATGEVVDADVVQGTNSVTVTFGASQGANTILLAVQG